MKEKVLLVEFSLSGHHSDWLKKIVKFYLKLGYDVTVTLSVDESKDLYWEELFFLYSADLHLIELDRLKTVSVLLKHFGALGGEIYRWLVVRSCYQKMMGKQIFKFVLYPYLDYFTNICALIGPPIRENNWHGICMRQSYHYFDIGVVDKRPALAVIKKRLFRRLLSSKKLSTLLTIDRSLEEYEKKCNTLYAGRLRFLPDPIDLQLDVSREASLKYFSLCEKCFVILVYGFIDDRKGIDNLLMALNENLGSSSRIRVLVIGKQDENMQALIGGAEHIISVNEYADENVEKMAFGACDAVWLGYKNHLTLSGVLIQAAISGKPVIATEQGMIGWLCRKYRLGISVDCTNAVLTREAIDNITKCFPDGLDLTTVRTFKSIYSLGSFEKKLPL